MSAVTDQKKVCWDQFCVTRTGGMLAKCADIWLFGQHVADMSVTFLAKRGNAQQLGQVQCLCRRHVSPCQESWHRQWQDFYHTTTVGHLCAERMRCCCYFCCSCYYFCRCLQKSKRDSDGAEGMARQPGQVWCCPCWQHCIFCCRESWHRRQQDCCRSTTISHLCAGRMSFCCYFCCFCQTNAQEHHLDSVSSLLRCKTHKNRWRSRWGQ